jgi:pseudouridine-5'-phosphate glycosidase
VSAAPPALLLAPEVAQALDSGGPVVALETTIVTHGLPYPASVEAAQRAEAAVRAGGAIPATIGVIDGEVRVGLTPGALDELAGRARHGRARKLAAADLATAVARRDWGGTTVSATVFAAAASGIRLFATGGIGGVHRASGSAGGSHNLSSLYDVSSDLGALARSPVAVVSAGAKSILDLPATLEVLEAVGVPVWGYRTLELPAFYVAASGLALRERVDSADEVAAALAARWEALAQPGGVLLVQPPPAHSELGAARVEAAIARALARAAAEGIVGPAATPFLLSRVAAELGPPAVEVNVALLEANAGLAAEVAVAWARRHAGLSRS